MKRILALILAMTFMIPGSLAASAAEKSTDVHNHYEESEQTEEISRALPTKCPSCTASLAYGDVLVGSYNPNAHVFGTIFAHHTCVYKDAPMMMILTCSGNCGYNGMAYGTSEINHGNYCTDGGCSSRCSVPNGFYW